MWSPEDQELIRRLKEYNMRSSGLIRLKGVKYTLWVKEYNPKFEEECQDN
jgi:hypothetical protein